MSQQANKRRKTIKYQMKNKMIFLVETLLSIDLSKN